MLSKFMTLVSRIRVMLFIITLVLFTIFLLQNTASLQVRFLIFDARIPTGVLILVSTLVGFLGGYLVRWRRAS